MRQMTAFVTTVDQVQTSACALLEQTVRTVDHGQESQRTSRNSIRSW